VTLVQNRCFLYHVIGGGTGRWDVPVGGMGALTGELVRVALDAGAELRPGSPVCAIDTDGRSAEVRTADGRTRRTRHVLAAISPTLLRDLAPGALDDGIAKVARPKGSQLKLNLLLARLSRLRDPHVRPEDAFAGTFHVNESADQLDSAFRQAASGRIPQLPPCEAHCHSLTDPSILGAELRIAGAQTLTVSELAMPGGHIFHRDLSWPFAETNTEVGHWGVETAAANVWLAGAGARRGGGVSGIPGLGAARAVLAADHGATA
jgi:phytoene dehydrogenase-like protein